MEEAIPLADFLCFVTSHMPESQSEAADNSILLFPLMMNLTYRDLAVKLRLDKIRGDSWRCGILLAVLQNTSLDECCYSNSFSTVGVLKEWWRLLVHVLSLILISCSDRNCTNYLQSEFPPVVRL